MRIDDIEVVVAAGRGVARSVREGLSNIFAELETSAATRLLVAIDVCHAELSAVTVGIFSLYEGRLNALFGWSKPMKEVSQRLIALGETALVERLKRMDLAVNTLKHGKGHSHSALISKTSAGQVRVRGTSVPFYPEGDVCPIPDLVEATPELLEECCDVIEATWQKVRPA